MRMYASAYGYQHCVGPAIPVITISRMLTLDTLGREMDGDEGERHHTAGRRSVRITDVARACFGFGGDSFPGAQRRPKRRSAVARARAGCGGRLGYRPNRLARNLRRQHMEALGVVVPDIENPHFAEMVRTIEVIAIEMGYRVLVCNTDEDGSRQAACLTCSPTSGWRHRAVSVRPRRCIDHLRISVSPWSPSTGRSSTQSDLTWRTMCRPCARDAAADRHGHRRIAFVGGRCEVETGSERQEGYLAAVRPRD